MTTENEKREISQLLALGTYQEMSDEEIDSIIEYKVDREVRRRLLNGNVQLINTRIEEMRLESRESSERSHAMLKSIMDRKPTLISREVSNV